MTSRDHAMRMLGARLKQAGLSTPLLDARLLVQAVTGADEIEMIREPGKAMSEAEIERLAEYEHRRIAHEPVSRIIGAREFWGLSFVLSGATLDPRPDSEVLIEAALDLLQDVKEPRLLDLGTGTGCLLLALLHERPDATGIGVDLSPDAVSAATENAKRLDLAARAEFRHGNWTDGISERFDLVISNPPYIASEEIDALDEEVRTHDPFLALDGGEDGLDAYRTLARQLPDVLTQGGYAVIELGQGQEGAVTALLEGEKLAVSKVVPDLAGIARALVARMA